MGGRLLEWGAVGETATKKTTHRSTDDDEYGGGAVFRIFKNIAPATIFIVVSTAMRCLFGSCFPNRSNHRHTVNAVTTTSSTVCTTPTCDCVYRLNFFLLRFYSRRRFMCRPFENLPVVHSRSKPIRQRCDVSRLTQLPQASPSVLVVCPPVLPRLWTKNEAATEVTFDGRKVDSDEVLSPTESFPDRNSCCVNGGVAGNRGDDSDGDGGGGGDNDDNDDASGSGSKGDKSGLPLC
eukprot:CAMPEP_0171991236 /NCGR_PEP_ID=MMETSP0993-20121228/277325_1 /TAXON_ID=483369 /ORGANISM="non described non described, Strain CCMP2098" /LENGTH=235 /DNA_ID=CAMNT_0012644255 /DNA_START=382 /DNA_END=1090 /DNA_ORIENTATION=-